MALVVAKWRRCRQLDEEVAVRRDDLRERLIAFENVMVTRFAVSNNATRRPFRLAEGCGTDREQQNLTVADRCALGYDRTTLRDRNQESARTDRWRIGGYGE
ncbi:hypothetical protein PP564_13015 [Mycobacteroides abscessus]|uniref:hypothetical protein n=1 Tax=Mycobacteroides abscessus TaxID=36809 RepID=UPI0013001653|nr:hypothetical protein [Mycobacteroides abscessus]MDM2496023.1 hypothetical protein [Mycobacteroides abscessus]MDM2523594.1 hypothetical protein [Mycobacteroides abscessus]MDM2529779.1 hypothetical protein [Mycobacteroides abscessus]MDM2531368.1 hypothetical protein [Mycobacteroides abscessus]MDM2536625.1 hypothetical protein [Mycobacteroides abscessus]